ncbi:MAG TPA: hypothetical protein VHV10_00610, partial [Ktedonobacteraceae bacterium]|nr:hypothetical protein [Ktedonobacteraceae bacterium]
SERQCGGQDPVELVHADRMEEPQCDTRSLVRSGAKKLPAQCPGLSLIPLCVTGNGEVESEG